MDNWIALVKTRMGELGITQEKLAEFLGVSQGAVAHWLNRRRTPSFDTMNRVLLILGLGSLQPSGFLPRVGETPGTYEATRILDALPGESERLQLHSYRLLEWNQVIGKGARSRAASHEGRFLATDYEAQGPAFWLQIVGESMNAPSGLSVSDGMRILFDQGLKAQPSDLVLVSDPTRPMPVFRQWVLESGEVLLRPLNPNYPTLALPEGGRVLAVAVLATLELHTF